MKLRASLMACAISSALVALPLSAMACSTVIVGKDASATGQVIVGHNEDNGGRIFNPQYWVPAAKHKAGEMIKYEPTAAMIPQVPETLGFYWSQTLDPNGSSFSDGFVNEAGVVIVSNACSNIFDKDQKLKDGGIGYGIRRLMAERAHSAREAVKIATDLLTKYGYFSEGRTYTIADTKEAWQLAIHKGNVWVARRVQDNEVIYIPNNFMMDKVDATDTENVIVSPGLIERSIQNGRYKPATPGVYSDFNFREAVQPAEQRAVEYNFSRNQLAWEYITGDKITNAEQFPYSFTPDKKFTVQDVKNILRLHEDRIGNDENGWYHHLGFGPCRVTTHESVVFEINDVPELITSYRALARPCETPYVPFYPLAKPGKSMSFMDAATATAEQFNARDSRFDYHPEFASMTFVNNANTLEFQRDDIDDNWDVIEELEEKWADEQAGLREQAKTAMKVSKDHAMAILHRYNVAKLNEASGAIQAHLDEIAPHKVVILADEIDPKSSATVRFALLSDDDLDATKIDQKHTWGGVGRSSLTTSGVMGDLAQPVAFTAEDVNGDGKKDMVMTFVQKDLARFMLAGAVYDAWLYTSEGGDRIAAFDTVQIKGQTNRKYSNRERGHDR